MIECDKLCVRLGGRQIITELSARFDDGTTTVILGKNGSGKTTLLKAMAGIYAYSGSVRINGAELKKQKRTEVSKKVSVLPQILPQPPVTAATLAGFGRSPYTGISGILSPTDLELIEHAIDAAGIESLRDKFVDKISGGERRKAFFAMTLAQNAGNVLLDEPCANLDAEYIGTVTELIKRLKSENKAVVAVFHDVNMAFELADRLIFLENGNCIFNGTPNEAAKKQIPEKIFSLTPYTLTDAQGNRSIFYK